MTHMCLQLHARTREVDKRMSELLATLGGLARPIAQRRDPMILSAIHYDQVILCIVDGEHAINLPNLGMGDDDHQGVGVWDGRDDAGGQGWGQRTQNSAPPSQGTLGCGLLTVSAAKGGCVFAGSPAIFGKAALLTHSYPDIPFEALTCAYDGCEFHACAHRRRGRPRSLAQLRHNLRVLRHKS